jgi:hypothetical protein
MDSRCSPRTKAWTRRILFYDSPAPSSASIRWVAKRSANGAAGILFGGPGEAQDDEAPQRAFEAITGNRASPLSSIHRNSGDALLVSV